MNYNVLLNDGWHEGLLCDLLWSDPDKDVQGWGENDRGVSFTFGPDVVAKFLNRHDLDLICRAHQVYLLDFLKVNKVLGTVGWFFLYEQSDKYVTIEL